MKASEHYVNSSVFRKAVAQRFKELRDYFGLSDPDKVVTAALSRTASAEVSLMRLEELCEKAPPGDVAFSYLRLERDRADRKYRDRFASLERLTGKTIAKIHQDNLFAFRAHFGYFAGVGNKSYTHWGWILAHPLTYGFLSRVPRCAKRIHGEYFLTSGAVAKLKAAFNDYCDRLPTRERDALIEQANQFEREHRYTPLPAADWRRHFDKKSKSKGSPGLENIFNDQLPAGDASIKAEKRIRNAIDYRHRKQMGES